MWRQREKKATYKQHLDFGLLASRKVRKPISAGLVTLPVVHCGPPPPRKATHLSHRHSAQHMPEFQTRRHKAAVQPTLHCAGSPGKMNYACQLLNGGNAPEIQVPRCQRGPTLQEPVLLRKASSGYCVSCFLHLHAHTCTHSRAHVRTLCHGDQLSLWQL